MWPRWSISFTGKEVASTDVKTASIYGDFGAQSISALYRRADHAPIEYVPIEYALIDSVPIGTMISARIGLPGGIEVSPVE